MANNRDRTVELVTTLYSLVQHADVASLRRLTPDSFDWTTLNTNGLPPLHMLVHAVLAEDCETRDAVECAAWMISKGADPSQVAPSWCECEYGIWREEEGSTTIMENSTINTRNKRHSAISLLMAWKRKIANNEKWGPGNDDTLNELLEEFTARPLDQRKLCSVDEGVVQMWESVFADNATHDVTFVCEGGSVGAHALVLSNASPVLRAMLSSGFREGSERRVNVADAPPRAIGLFLELLYTGGSTEEITNDGSSAVSVADALVALDVAHRWQVSGVVNMLDRGLVPLVRRRTFVQLAEAAILKSLPSLTNACVRFAQRNEEAVDSLERKDELSTAVLNLIGRHVAADGLPAAKRKRRSF